MQPKSIVLAAALAAGTTAALANDVLENVPVVGGTASFTALHTDALNFADVFNFAVTGDVLANASLITIGAKGQNIDFLSASLNGHALQLSPTGYMEMAFTPEDISLVGPLVLTVTGKSGAGKGAFASYAGTLNVAAVPEPGTYALMLAGLVGVGFMARRRRAA